MIQRLYKSKILLQAENSPTIAILLHFNGIRKEENTSGEEHMPCLFILQYNKCHVGFSSFFCPVVSALTPTLNDIVPVVPLFCFVLFFQNISSLLCFGKEMEFSIQSMVDHFFRCSSFGFLLPDASQGTTAQNMYRESSTCLYLYIK